VNARQAVNSSSFNTETNENTLLIVDSLDVFGPDADSLSGYQSLNMISGYTVGNWLIGPGVLISENFDINYGLGNLTILPATLTVKANDTSITCTGVQPVYRSINTFYKYDDADSVSIASGPDYTILNNLNANMGSGILPGGSYQLVPSNVVFTDSIPNYNIVYENGTLTVAASPASPVAAAGGPISFCAGGSVTLSSNAATGNQWYLNGSPINGQTGTTLLVNASGSYTVVSTSLEGCPSATSNAILVTVNPLAATPTATVTQPTCAVATGTITVTAPLGAGNSYTLDGTTTISWPSVSFSAVAPGVHTISVSSSFGCFAAATTSVTVDPQPFIPAAPVVTGLTNVCPFVGTATTVTYTATAAGATGYNWVLPPNVTLVSGAGTSTITVTFAAGFTAQANKQIRVTASSICGTSAQTIYYLQAQFPSTPGVITGPTDACPLLGTTGTYSVAPVLGASSYIWSAQAGTTIVPAGPGTLGNTVTITFPTTFTTSAVTVQVVNACGTSGTRSLTIVRNNPSVPSLISGPTNACAHIAPGGTPATYTVPAVAGITTYTWTVPAGAIGLTGQGTNTISFTYPSGYTSGTVSVKVTNGCGTSEPRSLTIGVLQPATPGVIDVAVTTPCPNRVYTYSLPGLTANATSILWTVTGGTILGGNGTSSITVSYPSTAVNGSVTAQAINNCSVSTIRSTAVRLPACPLNPPPPVGKNSGNYNTEEARDNTVKTTLPTEASMEVKIYPNPTVRDFIMKVITASGEEINVRVIDNQGRLYKSFRVMPYQTIALGAELKPGSYLVEVRQGTQVKTTKVIKF
jgi:hypothetical protein